MIPSFDIVEMRGGPFKSPTPLRLYEEPKPETDVVAAMAAEIAGLKGSCTYFMEQLHKADALTEKQSAEIDELKRANANLAAVAKQQCAEIAELRAARGVPFHYGAGPMTGAVHRPADQFPQACGHGWHVETSRGADLCVRLYIHGYLAVEAKEIKTFVKDWGAVHRHPEALAAFNKALRAIGSCAPTIGHL